MFFFYQIIISLIVLISPIVIFYRIYKNKEDKKRFKEKFSISTKKRLNGKLIWFHGSSVGEILSIMPIIKNYEKNKSIKQILVTSSTLSSSKIIKKFKFKKTIHQFFPIDHLYFTRKFLNYWKPNLAIFIESEIWPCMFKNLKNNKIPLVLLNARLTKKTFNRWIKLESFSRSVFNHISVTYPQNNETINYLKKMKVDKIKFLGNLKFIENTDNKKFRIKNNLKKLFKNKRIWVASSTHQNEEIFCSLAHKELKKRVNNLLTIIIPRHIHRTNEIISQIEKLNLKVTTHSSFSKNLRDIDIYIVDTFGDTNKFYKIGSTVFMGGSIIKRGGQNPLEAARLNSKILHGPNIDNFRDVYKFLRLNRLSKKINTPRQLASSIRFKKNKNKGALIKNIGEKILKKTIKELDRLI